MAAILSRPQCWLRSLSPYDISGHNELTLCGRDNMATISEKTFFVCKMAAILSRPQCVPLWIKVFFELYVLMLHNLCAEAIIFQENEVNIMTADALAFCVSRSSSWYWLKNGNACLPWVEIAVTCSQENSSQTYQNCSQQCTCRCLVLKVLGHLQTQWWLW